MYEYVLVTTADVPAEKLWAVAADLWGWADWQPVSAPSGGAWVSPSPTGAWPGLTVEEAVAPTRLTAVAARFLARVRFEYGFEPCARGTRIRVAVALGGGLGFAYRRSFDRYLQRNFALMVVQFVDRARAVTGPSDTSGPLALSERAPGGEGRH
ncbi:MAG TPA: SRPBCC family protein [Gemmata sp.]